MDFFFDYTKVGLFLFLLHGALAFILGSFVLIRKRPPQAHPPTPPGPRVLPIIGSLHLLGRLPHRSLQHLAKIHGPLMSLRLGHVPAVVASSPAMAKELLNTHELTFSSRAPVIAGTLLYDNADIGFAPYGPYWKLMRGICARDVFNNKAMERFRPIRGEELIDVMQTILEDSKMGREVPVGALLQSAAYNIISRMILGKKLPEFQANSGLASPFDNTFAIIAEVAELLAVFNIGDFFPQLQWMDLRGHVQRMKVARKSTKAVFQEIINFRRELLKREPSSSTYLLDALLKTSLENQADTSINDDNITAVLLGLFIGGIETSASSAEWALAELLRSPSILREVQKELDTVVGKGRLVRESDFPNLPFLDAVVKETMRLHPVVTLFTRESIEPCQVAGYYLPAKTLALINLWAIGRDENVWEKPLEFSPERFFGRSPHTTGHNYELLSFGTGRRSCPGWKLGLINVQLMLANIVHGFEWSLPNLKGELDMSETFKPATGMATPLLAMASPRLSEHLYSISNMG